MQVNSISNGYGIKFGALSSDLQDKMWNAISKKYSGDINKITKSKIYKDYQYILKNSNECFLTEDRKNGYIEDKNNAIQACIDVSSAYQKKEPYIEIIKTLKNAIKFWSGVTINLNKDGKKSRISSEQDFSLTEEQLDNLVVDNNNDVELK